MFSHPHEWQRPEPREELPSLEAHAGAQRFESLYRRLMQLEPDATTRAQAAEFLAAEIAQAHDLDDGLPMHPEDLQDWMHANTQATHARYASYLAQREAGAPRQFFTNRAHALYVLRNVAPTKLVDGAWLYGLVRHAHNPKMSDLVRTYVEELGEGDPAKNHVVLYRALLNRYNLDPLDDIDDAFYRQGLIQLVLGHNVEAFLPEVIGFNLSYEQLPLHLLITAHELNELGIDPYYFTLHITVDNGDTGHARRACEAVLDMIPRLADGGEFWQRVRTGSKLACAGWGTSAAIESFDLEREALRILARKSTMGHGAHSDYCRVAGKSVNQWLSQPQEMPSFVAALQDAGWIRRGRPVEESRFWGLLQGPRAEMFGVFSSYELQVLHDWIRADASVDGAAYTEAAAPEGRRRPTFRAMQRHKQDFTQPTNDALDPDLAALQAKLKVAQPHEVEDMLTGLMSPALHWTPAGLAATREFCAQRFQ